jgi:hypothetical protein
VTSFEEIALPVMSDKRKFCVDVDELDLNIGCIELNVKADILLFVSIFIDFYFFLDFISTISQLKIKFDFFLLNTMFSTSAAK